jgi:hypothetical protein
MTNLRIVYPREDGGVGVLIPCLDSGLTINEIADKDVPGGVEYAIVPVEELPEDIRFTEAWVADFSVTPIKVTVDPVRKAMIDKVHATADLEQWMTDQLNEGYGTGKGWKLGMQQSDVTLLTGNFVLAKEAAALNLPIPPVIDAVGGVHEMTMPELTELMLSYGQARAALSAEYASRKAALTAE